ncbi:MAG: DUF1232 domain-containing protein [Bacteroidales bacterium]|nr:DUF1232 domain-containing protein [Bacteroidales bacterium]
MSKQNLTSDDLQKYQDGYSEDAFWNKLKKMASKAGVKAVYYALVLFYTLTDPATPAKYKAVIAGALGYFILPIDLLPDFLPFAGLADDWAALVVAVSYVVTAITPRIREKARIKLRTWFPDATESDLGDIG